MYLKARIKRMVSPETESKIACRNEPGPLSAPLVTTMMGRRAVLKAGLSPTPARNYCSPPIETDKWSRR